MQTNDLHIPIQTAETHGAQRVNTALMLLQQRPNTWPLNSRKAEPLQAEFSRWHWKDAIHSCAALVAHQKTIRTSYCAVQKPYQYLRSYVIPKILDFKTLASLRHPFPVAAAQTDYDSYKSSRSRVHSAVLLRYTRIVSHHLCSCWSLAIQMKYIWYNAK